MFPLTPLYDLILFTKGDAEEHKHKVEKSAIENFFKDVVIVSEKDTETYHRTERSAAKYLDGGKFASFGYQSGLGSRT